MGQMVHIEFSAYLMWTLMILLLPAKWIVAAAVAAVLHELCHLAAVQIVGGKVLGIKIGAGGTSIQMLPMEPREELICALAGPAGSLVMLSLLQIFPRAAVCAGVQAMFNLLPVYPLDGARILRSTAQLLCPQWAEKILTLAELLAVVGIIAAAWVLSFVVQLGIVPLFFAAGLILKVFLRKIPCKEGRIGVQ